MEGISANVIGIAASPHHDPRALVSRRLAVPLYDYQCKDCREVFDVRASIKEREDGLVLTCPKCGSREARQRLTFASMLHGDKLSPTPACGPGAGPGCCG